MLQEHHVTHLERADTRSRDEDDFLIPTSQEDKEAVRWLKRKIKMGPTGKYGMTPVVGELTPSLARVLLDRNPENRKLSEANVGLIAGELTDGAFRANGASVVISDGGLLVDGQNRCQAVLNTNIPMPTVFVFGPKYETRLTTDTGKAKTTADLLSMDGVAYPKEIAAAITTLYAHHVKGWYTSLGGKDNVNRGQLVRFSHTLDDIQGQASLVCAEWDKTIPVSRSTLLVFFNLIARRHKEKAEEFLSVFKQDYGYSGKLDPIRTARTRLTSDKLKYQNQRRYFQIEILARAWNAWREGRRLGKIQVRGEVPKLV